MSLGTLASIWTQNQNGSGIQASGTPQTTSSQSYSNWVASLMQATGHAPSADPASAGATMSDQMQALLMQMQAGGTTAPTAGAAGQTASVSASASAAGGADVPPGTAHHHHHHGGTGDVDQNSNDLFTDVAAELQGSASAASGATTAADAPGFLDSVGEALKIYGAAALKGAATAAVVAAI